MKRIIFIGGETERKRCVYVDDDTYDEIFLMLRVKARLKKGVRITQTKKREIVSLDRDWNRGEDTKKIRGKLTWLYEAETGCYDDKYYVNLEGRHQKKIFEEIFKSFSRI